MCSANFNPQSGQDWEEISLFRCRSCSEQCNNSEASQASVIGLLHIYSNCDRLLMFLESDYPNSITPNQILLARACCACMRPASLKAPVQTGGPSRGAEGEIWMASGEQGAFSRAAIHHDPAAKSDARSARPRPCVSKDGERIGKRQFAKRRGS